MGQDPWGRAYTYRIEPAEAGRLRVEMRSAGPDGRLEIDGGDDVLLTLSL